MRKILTWMVAFLLIAAFMAMGIVGIANSKQVNFGYLENKVDRWPATDGNFQDSVYNVGILGEGAGEKQPVLEPAYFGDIKISLPAREIMSCLDSNNLFLNNEAGIQVGYALIYIGYSDSYIDTMGQLIKLEQKKNTNGYDIIFWSNDGKNIGICRCDNCTITVIIYGKDEKRLMQILDSIRPLKPDELIF